MYILQSLSGETSENFISILIFILRNLHSAFRIEKAEGVGFEPTRAFWTLLVFKTSAFNRSAIPPRRRDYTALLVSESGADDKLFHTAMAVTGMKKALAY